MPGTAFDGSPWVGAAEATALGKWNCERCLLAELGGPVLIPTYLLALVVFSIFGSAYLGGMALGKKLETVRNRKASC